MALAERDRMPISSETSAARPRRELAAIMFSDIAGYTLMMGRDEREGLRARSVHGELLRSLLPKFDGRMISDTGDGALSSFHSAVDAVNCACAFQASLKGEPQFRVRIGIHVGDVLFSEDTVLGDGVNVASRIQALAPPGGICISERVFEEIRNKPDLAVRDLGEKALKNVTRPIRVYVLESSDGTIPRNSTLSTPWFAHLTAPRLMVTAAALLAAAAIAVVALKAGNLTRGLNWRYAARPQIHSLAVLPLENLSGDPSQEYFADGMTEELITDLAKISALRVISRTSVMQFKGQHRERLPQIAKDLDVDAVVEGSVLKIGDKVRITVQLIDAHADRHLWADKYERDSHDVLALQDDLAAAIAREIDVKLTPQEKAQFASARPVNPEAHEAYLQGRYFLAKWTQEGRASAKRYFEQAIQIDPSFALGYAGLADYYWQAADWELPQSVAMPKARELAEQALKLDDSLAEAHTALGSVDYFFDYDAKAAEKELLRAIALNPGYAEAHHVYGWVLTAQGRFGEAETQMKEARLLDPLSAQLTADVGMPIGWGGQPERALKSCHKALELDPAFFGGYYCLAMNYDLMGRRAQALEEAKKGSALEPVPLIMGVLGYEYALQGSRVEAQKILGQLEQLSQQSYVSPYFAAEIYLGLGDTRKTLDLLEQAYQQRSGTLVFVGVDRRMASLRAEPRFQELLKKIGAPLPTQARID